MRTAQIALLFVVLSVFGIVGAGASTLDLFGGPNALFCPDLFKSNASVEDRLVEAYARTIEIYRESLTDEKFQKMLENLLKSKSYYHLSKGATSAHAGAELAAKIGEAVRHNEFPGGEKLNQESFEERIRAHLEDLLGKSRAAVRVVEKSVAETQTARLPFHVLRGHTESLTWAQVSSDFSKAFSSADDGKLFLWDLKQATKVNEYWVPPKVQGRILVNEDATLAFGATSGHLLTIWNPMTKEADYWSNQVAMSDFRVNSDFTRAVGISFDGEFTFLDLKNKRNFSIPKPASAIVISFEVNVDFSTAVGGADDGNVLFWKIGSETRPEMYRPHEGRVSAVQFTADSQRVFTGSIFGNLVEWDVKTHQILHDFGGIDDAIMTIRIREDSKQALLGMGSGNVLLMDLESGTILHRFRPPFYESISDMAVNRDFTRAVSTSFDRTLTLFDLEKREKIVILSEHSKPAMSVKTNADFTRALTTSSDGTLILWDLELAEQGAFKWAY